MYIFNVTDHDIFHLSCCKYLLNVNRLGDKYVLISAQAMPGVSTLTFYLSAQRIHVAVPECLVWRRNLHLFVRIYL